MPYPIHEVIVSGVEYIFGVDVAQRGPIARKDEGIQIVASYQLGPIVHEPVADARCSGALPRPEYVRIRLPVGRLPVNDFIFGIAATLLASDVGAARSA